MHALYATKEQPGWPGSSAETCASTQGMANAHARQNYNIIAGHLKTIEIIGKKIIYMIEINGRREYYIYAYAGSILLLPERAWQPRRRVVACMLHACIPKQQRQRHVITDHPEQPHPHSHRPTASCRRRRFTLSFDETCMHRPCSAMSLSDIMNLYFGFRKKNTLLLQKRHVNSLVQFLSKITHSLKIGN